MRKPDFGPVPVEKTLPFYGPIVGRTQAGLPMVAGPLTMNDCRAMKKQVDAEGVFLPKKLAKEWGLRENEVYHALRMVPQ